MPETKYCGMCCHCNKGVPYDKHYFFCTACDLMICNGCHSKHPKSHAQFSKRGIDRSTPRDAFPTKKKCLNCARFVHERVECSSCEIIVCFPCFSETLDNFAGHEHKGLTFYRIPDDHQLPEYEKNCGSCAFGSSMIHCNRCYEGVMEGEMVYECRDCNQKWDGTPTLCRDCVSVGQAAHDPSHVWSSFVYREMPRLDEKAFGGKCLDCNYVLPSLAAEVTSTHPHTSFQIEVGCLERSAMVQQNYRKCPRRAIKNMDRKDEDLYDGKVGCHCCWNLYGKNPENYFCMKCDFSTCTSCYEDGIANHPHPMVSMHFIATAPPDDFWRSLANGDHRFCDCCKENFRPLVQSHMRCRVCKDYDICQSCMSKPEATVEHARCGSSPGFYYFDPKEMDDEWIADQVERAQAFLAQQEAKAAAAARPAPSPQRTAAPAPARKPVVQAARAPAPAQAPRPTVKLAPPQPRPAQRQKSSSGLGSALLKGAMGGMQLLNAMNAANSGTTVYMNGSSGGSGGGGGGMDMSSFWGPINAAASSPIQ